MYFKVYIKHRFERGDGQWHPKLYQDVQLNPFTLSFRGHYASVERYYIVDTQIQHTQQQRILLAFSILAYVMFIFVDINSLPHLAPLFAFIRFGLYTPLAAVTILLSYTKKYVHIAQPLLTALSLSAFFGLLFIHYHGSQNGFYSYRFAILFTLIYVLFFFTLRFIYSVATAISILVFYNLLQVVTGVFPAELHLDSNILFLFVAFFGCLFNYLSEKNDRMQYVLKLELNKERETIQSLNEHLEKRVISRTKALKEAYEKLAMSEHAFKELMTASDDGVVLLASDRIIDCNDVFLKFFNCHEKKDALNAPLLKVIGSNPHLLEAFEKDAFSSGGLHIEHKASTGNQLFELSFTPINLPEQSVLYLVVKNVTERYDFIQQLEYLSFKDPLTDLYNRRYFKKYLENNLTFEDYPVAIVLSDVNGLKLVNDTFGHMVGDRYLKEVAQQLTAVFTSPSLVSRLSGDEFAIVIPNATKPRVSQLLQQFKTAVRTVKIAGVPLSLSFGYAIQATPDDSFENTYKTAEDYMYRHKVLESPSIRRRTIDMMIQTLHEKNPIEKRHSKRTTKYALELGRAIGLSEQKLKELEVATLLHDVGKIAISEVILSKKEPLTKSERLIIQQHCEIGYRILNTSDELRKLSEYVLYHHEHWDGTGYPVGIKGDKIPLLSRIICIADAYDDMIHERPYRHALTPNDALEELERCSGKQFDPTLVAHFIDLRNSKSQTTAH